jgi:2-keto-4-pentenoate hydratase/2-oxohepta-3-ene-1,7-dioic acid hydratase in catechol pathway
MKFVVFGAEQRVGLLLGEQIIDLNRGSARLPSRLLELIEAGPAALNEARRIAGEFAHAKPDIDGIVQPLSRTKLRAPWPGRRIACVGGNYAQHLLGMWANRLGRTDITLELVTEEARKAGQWGFWKVPAEVGGPNDTIPFPKRVTYFDYEGEVAIVIGKRGKNIPAAKIDDYVWGVTLLHDWSIRDGGGTDRVVSYNLQKNFDGAVAMGPCIVVDETHQQEIPVETRVNGVVRQSYSTREMIWDFGEVLEYLSQDFTFVPGDVIAGGTSAGTAADKSRRSADGKRPLDLFLKIGDTVEVSSPKIGALANKIVASD